MPDKSRIRRLDEVPVQTGLPAGIKSPVKPELFAGKHEAQLGKAVGITQFGVNNLRLEPGAISSLRHWHQCEDEFVYVLSGEVTLIDDNGEHALSAGSCVGFPAGQPNAHHFVNRSVTDAVLIVVGTRKAGEEMIHYPDDDLAPVKITRGANGERLVS